MTDLTHLETLLREARGPDREIDGRLWCFCLGYDFVQWDGAGCVYRDKPKEGVRHWHQERLPEYTRSIDAALGLVGRVLPRFGISIGRSPDGMSQAVVFDPNRRKPPFEFRADRKDGHMALTACLALITALKAKEAGNV